MRRPAQILTVWSPSGASRKQKGVMTMMRNLVCLLAVLACTTCVQADFPIIQTVDSPGNVGYYNSLALDSSGHPRIAYWDATNQDLRYAAWNGSSWDIQTLDSTGSVGWCPSLAVDSSDYPHIIYGEDHDDNHHDRYKYAYKNNSGWHVETVPDQSNAGWPGSLALDSEGHAHISYMTWKPWTRRTLWYGVRDGSPWSFEPVDQTGVGAGVSNSLALDSNSRPHIAYSSQASYGGPRRLSYAAGTDSGWDIQFVGTAANAGWGTSLALDSSGHPHISYQDRTNENLKYAWWDPSLDGGAGAWDITTVDSMGDLCGYTSLALDSSRFAHISYYNQTNQELRYAVGSGSDWDIQTVDASGAYRYQNSSLALDSHGFAHISYHDGTNQDLMYANNTPELSTLLLLGVGLPAAAALRRRKKRL